MSISFMKKSKAQIPDSFKGSFPEYRSIVPGIEYGLLEEHSPVLWGRIHFYLVPNGGRRLGNCDEFFYVGDFRFHEGEHSQLVNLAKGFVRDKDYLSRMLLEHLKSQPIRA